MASVRDAFGHFRRVEQPPAEPPEPQPDNTSTAADALRQAERELADYQVEINAIRLTLHTAQERRAAHLEAGEVDETLAAETEIRRQEIHWEIIGRRGAELTEAVDRARAAVRREEWRKLQPELRDAYTALHTAALALAQGMERVRELEQQARNLGVAPVGETPEYRAINAYVLGQWIEQAQGQPHPQAA
jgi:hypothetical protein